MDEEKWADDYEKRVGYEPDRGVLDFISEYQSGKLVLDVGCGHGRNALAVRALGHRVVGLDINLYSLRKAKNRKKDLDLVLGSSLYLPFKDEAFDFIISIGLLQCLDLSGVESTLREMRRVLDGDMYLSCFSDLTPDEKKTSHHLYLGKKELFSILEKVGFEVKKYAHEWKYRHSRKVGFHNLVCK